MPPNRRLAVPLLVLLIVAMVLAACGQAATPAPAEPAATPPEATAEAPAEPTEPPAEPTETPAEATEAPTEATEAPAEITRANTLVIGLTEDTVTLDPGRAYETHANTVHQAIYETLVTFPPDRVDEIVPGLAESWEIADDGLIYTFTLKEGPTFSTGRPVQAKDVAFSINRLRHLQGNPSFLANQIESVEATDEQTVVITLSEPDPALLAKLVFTAFGVMDSEEAIAHGATDAEDAAETDTAEQWLNDNSIGSGPYVLKKWEPKVEAILERNPEFAGEPAAIPRVIFRNLSETAAQKLALEAGDVDIALDVTADQVPSLANNPDIVVFEDVSEWVFFVLMNMDESIGGPMSNDLVQDAVRRAIDYEGIRELVGGAAATPVNIMLVHWPYALDPEEGIDRDVEAAQELLAEAGFPDGLNVTLDFPEFDIAGVSVATLAQKLQADLAEVGITVELRPAELQVALERYRNGQDGFSIWAWHPDFIDPIDRTSFMPGGKVGLRANWSLEQASPELAEVTQRALVETDPAERAEVFAEAQGLMLEESAFAFLVQPGLQVAYRNQIEGFAFNSMWRINPYTMSLK